MGSQLRNPVAEQPTVGACRPVRFYPHLSSPRFLAIVFSIVTVALGLFAKQSFLPSWNHAGGDFANYYTASRLVAEGKSLEPAYRSFGWFQRQMDRYGIRNQVGGWIPHPPTTALVFLPLVRLEPLTAKRVWLLLNLILAALSVCLLARTSGLAWLETLLVFLACGYGLGNNFLFGQLYLLLLASILLCLFLWQKGHATLAGIALGLMIPVKYVGLPFLLFFLWKRQWRLCTAATLSVLVVVVTSLLLTDVASFRTFLIEVLPRHLQGEIQDPYSVSLQTWNSLFRRMFLYEPILSPAPVVVSPFLFLVTKNLAFWGLLAFGLLTMSSVRLPTPEAQTLFQLAWIPLLVLLLSPAGATYHFLLLSISAVFLVRILLGEGRRWSALGVGSTFLLVNLPHYMKLAFLASGWLIPLAYTRLWTLLFFALLVLFLFRSQFLFERSRAARISTLAVSGFLIVTAIGYGFELRKPEDAAVPIEIPEAGFRRNLGLIVESPTRGKNRMLFSYCELFEERYSIFTLEGLRWPGGGGGNLYHPELYADDSTLLVETISNGHSEIWGNQGEGRPVNFFLVEGQNPAWRPGGLEFAFERDGKLFLYTVQNGEVRELSTPGKSFDPVFSIDGRHLFYAVGETGGDSLRELELDTGRETTLVPARGRLQTPSISPDGRALAFSGSLDGGWDIWLFELAGGRLWKVTSDPALDRDPVWSEDASTITFLSDRRRGLACTTLYSIQISEEFR